MRDKKSPRPGAVQNPATRILAASTILGRMPLLPLEVSVFLGGTALVLFLAWWVRPRRFYIVRHGETILNAQHIRQGAEGKLSPAGRTQAQIVGKHLKPFKIKQIISSPYERAKETSELINESLRVPILYSSVLAERRNPSEIIGKHRDLPEVRSIIEQIELAYHPDDYRYSDEENFLDLKKRAREALTLLSRQGHDRTVIVTHHVFLKIFLAYLLHREHLHAKDFVKVSFFNFSDNAAVTIVEFNPLLFWNRTRGWRVIAFNEKVEK